MNLENVREAIRDMLGNNVKRKQQILVRAYDPPLPFTDTRVGSKKRNLIIEKENNCKQDNQIMGIFYGNIVRVLFLYKWIVTYSS